MESLTTTTRNTLAPANFKEAVEFSKMMASSSLVPQAYRNKPADILIAMQMGAEVGLKPMQAIQGIAVINGKPCLYGDSMLSVVTARQDCGGVEESVVDGVATCTVHRKGRPSVTRTFSVEDAQRAKLWGRRGPWTEYPNRMLQMRARGFALRDCFPDALKGIMPAEEVRDYNLTESSKPSPVVDVTPATDVVDDDYLTQEQSEELTNVLSIIERSNSKDDLGDVIQPASKLEGRDRVIAQNAYRNKLKTLRGLENPIHTLKTLSAKGAL
jgi:hypothetical protein